MSLVDVAVGETIFAATLLETPDQVSYLQVEREVALLFKETEVSLAKNLQGEISLRNRFSVIVTHIERGDIMSAVDLDFMGQSLTSVITTRGVNRLQLAVGEQIEALVKANEIALMECADAV